MHATSSLCNYLKGFIGKVCILRRSTLRNYQNARQKKLRNDVREKFSLQKVFYLWPWVISCNSLIPKKLNTLVSCNYLRELRWVIVLTKEKLNYLTYQIYCILANLSHKFHYRYWIHKHMIISNIMSNSRIWFFTHRVSMCNNKYMLQSAHFSWYQNSLIHINAPPAL